MQEDGQISEGAERWCLKGDDITGRVTGLVCGVLQTWNSVTSPLIAVEQCTTHKKKIFQVSVFCLKEKTPRNLSFHGGDLGLGEQLNREKRVGKGFHIIFSRLLTELNFELLLFFSLLQSGKANWHPILGLSFSPLVFFFSHIGEKKFPTSPARAFYV